jgi:hypothetical protein
VSEAAPVGKIVHVVHIRVAISVQARQPSRGACPLERAVLPHTAGALHKATSLLERSHRFGWAPRHTLPKTLGESVGAPKSRSGLGWCAWC